ncbi:hypothetical protein CCO03_05315 [Comamonas serinivorans]|uniref:Uncharacterized protein n=1 Tax=Comamonas serinivorans TaxID=1082851 RepID=A0A1Y0EKK3_9BURK|nr:hypothetical protein CCO03_05315 [Comamonas serinivorans]
MCLAATAAQDMVAGRSVQLAPLVHALRAVIRSALDLEPVPANVVVPDPGPLRPSPAGGGARNGRNTGPASGAGGRGGGAGARTVPDWAWGPACTSAIGRRTSKPEAAHPGKPIDVEVATGPSV